jgi:hypothetical protein
MIDLLTVERQWLDLPPRPALSQYYPLIHSNSSPSGICSALKPDGLPRQYQHR